MESETLVELMWGSCQLGIMMSQLPVASAVDGVEVQVFECAVHWVARAGKSVDSDDILGEVIRLDTLDVDVAEVHVGDDVAANVLDF